MTEFSQTQLATAIKGNKLKTVKRILQNKSKLIQESICDAIIYQILKETPNKQMISLVLKQVKYLNLSSDPGMDLLYIVGSKNYYSIAKLIFKFTHNPPASRALTTHLLFSALEYGHLKIARLCIKYMVDIGLRNDDGKTAIFLASHCDDTRCIDFVLEHGADIDSADNEGRNALFEAIHLRKNHIVEKLLKCNINANLRDKRSRTPLMFACLLNDYQCVALLIKYGANIYARNKFTDVFSCISFDSKISLKIGKLFIKSGSDIDLFYKRIHFIIHQIQMTENYDILSEIIDMFRKGNKNLRDENGNTVLHRLMKMNINLRHTNWKCAMNKLLNKGFDVDARNDQGMTGLQIATTQASLDNVKYLCKIGADLLLKNNEGKTALDIAKESNNLELTTYLTKKTKPKDKLAFERGVNDELLTTKEMYKKFLIKDCNKCYNELADVQLNCQHILCEHCSEEVDVCPVCDEDITEKVKMLFHIRKVGKNDPYYF